MTQASDAPASYRGRFAPSPTGRLHLGSLLAAVASFLRARSRGGAWLVRMEDLDPPRESAGAAQDILDTLSAFALTADEPVLFQSTRGAAYLRALERLIEAGDAFPCRCSRAQIQARGGHRGRCDGVRGSKRAPAWRMLAPDLDIAVDDAIQGRYTQNLQREVGDFVLRRSDGLWSYQLAVVVDDAAQGITEIVRGADLLDSTPRQVWLQRRLGLPTPAYAHLPVLLGDDGQKLSKQTYAEPVDREQPMPALRHALQLLGIPSAAIATANTPAEALTLAVPRFDLAAIPRTPALRTATWRQEANG